MKFSIPESRASSCASLLQWSWNYLCGNHFSGVQREFLALDRTVSNVVWIRIQKSLMFPGPYCQCSSQWTNTPLLLPLDCHLLLSESQYFTPGITLHALHCLCIRGPALCVMFLFQDISMRFLAHSYSPLSAARAVLPPSLYLETSMPLIILTLFCSEKAGFFALHDTVQITHFHT